MSQIQLDGGKLARVALSLQERQLVAPIAEQVAQVSSQVMQFFELGDGDSGVSQIHLEGPGSTSRWAFG